MFSDILSGTAEPPASWSTSKLRIIFKKGDMQLPQNYRPISIIPVLAKLFSTILYGRLEALVDGKLADSSPKNNMDFGRGVDAPTLYMSCGWSSRSLQSGANHFTSRHWTSRRRLIASTMPICLKPYFVAVLATDYARLCARCTATYKRT